MRIRAGVMVAGMTAVLVCFAPSLLSATALARGRSVERRVIVLLKNQASGRLFTPAFAGEREHAFAREQAPVLSQMSASGARRLRSYRVVNAVSGTVSVGEEARLKADPAVGRVIPDEVIHFAQLQPRGQTAGNGGSSSRVVCAPDGGVELDPQALETIGADSDQPGAKTARSLGLTGAGVTVAFLADGLDVNNPDLVRPDGEDVVVDYKDFTGEGTAVPTGGAEAFLDASAVAAQGRQVYDVSDYSALPLSQPCRIRIEGVAPGARLVALDVLGSDDAGFTSSLLQAIDYAVTVDHVQVINESLADNPYPDDQGPLEVIKQANDNAEAAGTTVVAAAGDAGPTNTIGDPASDPAVISTGASTTYRALAQSGVPARFPGESGWLDDNISSLSSSGFTQAGRTISLVAPGDLNWALCSTDVAMYASCYDDADQPDPVTLEGGTSQAAPLTAGVVALVIQAYEKTHGGTAPSPALIKQLIMSTADDIGAPADLQGSGRLDAYQAVLAAESHGSPAASSGTDASTLLKSATQLNATDSPGRPERLVDTITNPSTGPQVVSLSTRTLGAYQLLKSATVDLEDASSPHIPDEIGYDENYESVTFNVPPGQNRLSASAAFLSATASTLTYPVMVTLLDPSGKLASFSLPQGEGNYGTAQVTDPAPGRWTAYISSLPSTAYGTTGPVRFAASSASYTSFGRVSPSTVVLPAGSSRNVNLDIFTPAQPGDASGAIILDTRSITNPTGTQTTIPVTLRSLIPTGPQAFTGVLTGGNGRNIYTGQTFYYQMRVPAGAPELNADIQLNGDPDNPFNAFLVSPSGQAVADATNDLPTSAAPGYVNEAGAQLHALTPIPGIWTLIIAFAPQVSGTALAEPVTVATNQTLMHAASGSLPDSRQATLPRGQARTYEIKLHNTGTTPEAYFLDARLSAPEQLSLVAQNASGTSEPLTFDKNLPTYLVPTDTTEFAEQASTTGSEPIEFSSAPALGLPSETSGDGDPDIESTTGLSASASLADNPIAQGLWSIQPNLIGPFGPQSGTPEPVTTSMSVTTQAFDSTVTSPGGDLWRASTDPALLGTFAPVLVAPGQAATIPVTITPSGKPGTTINGTLYVDDASLLAFQINPDIRGSQLTAIPYRYTIK